MFLFQTIEKNITKKDVAAAFSSQMQKPDEQLKQLKNISIATVEVSKKVSISNIDFSGGVTKNMKAEKIDYNITRKGEYVKLEKTDIETGKHETGIFKADDKEGIKKFIDNDKIFEKIYEWIQDTVDENRKKLLGSKIKLKTPAPATIAKGVKDADKFMAEGKKASTDVADERSPLKTPGLEYGFEPSFDVGSSFD